ncbi:MAG: Spy/CpxP family protein refolding chaperone [Gammaproteobacteria bacterium]|nr:Spy/CpxP family protein refolding chaperone [Gammaproteobacteria bacterium]
MSTKKKVALITITSIILVSLVGCFNHSPEDKANWVISKISDKLELNENQKTKLVEVKDEALKARAKMQKDKSSHFEQVENMIQSERLNKQEIQLLFKSKTEKLAANAEPVIDKLIDFHADLNNEQKQKIIAFIKKHEKEGKSWRRHNHWSL